MATMNINIINPTISLISRPNTSSSKCESTFEFTIKSTPNASITIAATLPTDIISNDDLREFSYNLGSGYNLTTTSFNNSANYPFISNSFIKKRDIILNNTGEAKIRVVLANSEQAGKYYTTKVFVKDNTNNKEETKEFTRYDDSIKCKVGSEPIARDDNYTIISGTHNNFYITKNDERLHYISDYNKITFVTLPQHGTLTYILGQANYTNNGDGATSDSFTYTVETPDGLSNIATVNITIEQQELTIDNDTRIILSFDASGSMGGVLPVLKNMIKSGGALESKLRPSYNSDQSYEDHVAITSFYYERFLNEVSNNLNPSGNTIILIFQNETEGHYQNYGFNNKLKDEYVTDIRNYNTKVDAYTKNLSVVLFQVKVFEDINFKRLLQWIKEGQGNYSGANGLSSRDNFNIRYDVLSSDDSAQADEFYYTNLIVEELNKLGFNIT